MAARVIVLLAVLGLSALSAAAQDEGRLERVPWTTSRITGSPEPPPPFRTERAFPHLEFTRPVHLVPFPDHSRYVLVALLGKIYTFPDDPDCRKADLLIDLAKEIRPADGSRGPQTTLAFQFDPDFSRNRACYIMYVMKKRKGEKVFREDGSVVSRFTMTDTDPPRVDPASERILLRWPAGGYGMIRAMAFRTSSANSEPRPAFRLS